MISCAKAWTFECHMTMKNVSKRNFGRKCILKLHLMRGWEQNNFDLTVWWQINPFCQKRMPQRSKNYVSWLIINVMCYYLWLICEFIQKYPRKKDLVNPTVLHLITMLCDTAVGNEVKNFTSCKVSFTSNSILW